MNHNTSASLFLVSTENIVFFLHYFIPRKMEIIARITANFSCILFACWLTYHVVKRSFLNNNGKFVSFQFKNNCTINSHSSFTIHHLDDLKKI